MRFCPTTPRGGGMIAPGEQMINNNFRVKAEIKADSLGRFLGVAMEDLITTITQNQN